MPRTYACRTCARKQDEHEIERGIIVICFDAHHLKYNNKRNLQKSNILKHVCGLRNARIGRLYIHVKNHGRKNFYHGWLDKLIDEPLYNMIEDGSMFTDVYKKTWGSVRGDRTRHNGFLCITVRGAGVISTVDFNTHVQTDDALISPSASSVFSFLTKASALDMNIPESRGRQLSGLYECRNVQFKGITTRMAIKRYNLRQKLFFQHKLKGYISAFAKQKGGGHFYLGVEENIRGDAKNVLTSRKTGFKLDYPVGQFLTDIKRTLDDQLSIYDYSGNETQITPSDDLCTTNVYPANRGGYNLLEVCVSAYSGLVFETKDGPISFKFNHKTNKTEKIETKEWFEKIKNTYQNGKPTC